MDASNNTSWLEYLRATALMYSTLANPRLLESSTHPFWNIFCWEICGNSAKSLLPTPQWTIYVSPKDNLSNDPGNITLGDSDANGVITDFCLLLPFYTVGGNPGVYTLPETGKMIFRAQIKAFIQTLMPPWNSDKWRDLLPVVRLAYLAAPVLIELKQPITRHARDIFHYVQVIFSRLLEAAAQVNGQAACMFCSLKYANQKQVIVIIGAGEYYCYRAISKDELPQSLKWTYKEYARAYVGNDFLANLNKDNVEGETEYTEATLLPLRTSPEDIDKALQEVVRKNTERSRDLRAKNREKRKDILHSAHRDYRKLLAATDGEGHIFTHSELERAYDILVKLGEIGSELGPLRFGNHTDPISKGKWSKVTHIGSQCSNIYVSYIKEAMKRASEGKAEFL